MMPHWEVEDSPPVFSGECGAGLGGPLPDWGNRFEYLGKC